MQPYPYQHTPVMPQEVISFLQPTPGATLVDCTLGGGGHALALKKHCPTCRLIGFDQDAAAIAAAKNTLREYPDVTYIQDNFSRLRAHLPGQANGFLFDLGISSYQIDCPERGFSLQHDGPLDMRMDQRTALTAAVIINHYSTEELAKIFWDFGEERFARRVAKALVAARERGEIATTFQLKALVEQAIPTWKKRESVTRIFQALRLAVNDELKVLADAVSAALDLLLPGGRIVVLAYHSLEDRLVKQAFRRAAENDILKIMTKKPWGPSLEEVKNNPRARSAKLRAGEKR